MVYVGRAQKIDETISRTKVDRARAIENAGYYACKAGFEDTSNPYADCDGEIMSEDAQLWLDGFCEAWDEMA